MKRLLALIFAILMESTIFRESFFLLLIVVEFDNTLIISISLIQVYQFHEILVDFIIVLNSKKE